VQTFCHTSDTEPRLYLHREKDLARPGAALRHLVARPTSSAVALMLQAAGFDHVYRKMPAESPKRQDDQWLWSFFYGIKGTPLTRDDLTVV